MLKLKPKRHHPKPLPYAPWSPKELDPLTYKKSSPSPLDPWLPVQAWTCLLIQSNAFISSFLIPSPTVPNVPQWDNWNKTGICMYMASSSLVLLAFWLVASQWKVRSSQMWETHYNGWIGLLLTALSLFSVLRLTLVVPSTLQLIFGITLMTSVFV